MRPGTRIAGRFEIEARAGAGGMGVVYRAKDLEAGASVALKVLHVGQPSERFVREAMALSELSHPAIVRYVAHGTTSDGRAYLAMEWIDGSSLADLLKQRRLGVAETLTVVRRIAEGLAEAHRHGVVHRDVKPSNVHLPGNSPADAKLIDFGVARRRLDPHITESGLLVGTLAYMSPEQASGDSNIEPASDVFSLGCVLYKCLTGESPFFGGDATAVLAKVLLDDPAPIHELAPEVPLAVDALARRMLAKSVHARPTNAEAVLHALGAIGDVARLPSAPPPEPVLTAQERRVVWVLMVGGLSAQESVTREMAAPPGVEDSVRVDACATKYGGRYDVLADGTAVVTFTGSGAPTDEAVRAVRCGLDLLAIAPTLPIAAAMGLGVVGKRMPFGQAIDRGARALARAKPGTLRVDADAARLIGTRFAVESDGDGCYVSGERRAPDATRKLLGRPTPCVGRDRELALLEALYDECVSEPVARAALVTGPAGAGKSRLRYELIKRLDGHDVAPVVLMGRADSLSAGSPFALLREALRRSAGILDGEPPEASRDKLLSRLVRSAGSERARTIAPFIGELARVPFDDASSDTLSAARADPTLMGDAMRVAWLEFLALQSEREPVLLVLEDLHWGDGPTMSFTAAALSTLTERPLMLLALGRPEVHDVLPQYWKQIDLQELRLRPLLKSASERLVRDVLGDDVPEATMRRVVDLADGNAFHLEELIRAIAEGRSDLPESVLGMVQARLEALAPEERRVLRAASVFGERFWPGGVAALTGGESNRELDAALAALVSSELVSERSSSAFAGQAEYVFRHSLVREAAYAMLTDDDRTLGHRLAAEWLERTGDAEPLVLAEHFSRSGRSDRAAEWYARAAALALEGNDLRATIERVERALASNPPEQTRAELAYIEGHARVWQGDYAGAERPLQRAIELLPLGSARWFSALSDLSHVGSCLDRPETELDATERAISTEPDSDGARVAQIACLSRAASGRLKAGDVRAADVLIARLSALGESVATLGGAAAAWIHRARAARGYYLGDVPAFHREIQAATQAFAAAGDVRNATTDGINLGYLYLLLGDYPRAEIELSKGYELSARLGLTSNAAYALHNLGLAVSYSGRLDEGIAIEERAVALARRTEENKVVGAALAYLAVLLTEKGDTTRAIQAARDALEAFLQSRALSAYAHAVLAGALLAAGSTDDAYAEARTAIDLLGTEGAPEEVEARVRLTLAEAAHAAGDRDVARDAIRTARDRVRARAERIDDPGLRQTFLERVPEHQRTFALARAWLIDA